MAWIWENEDWPSFYFDEVGLSGLLVELDALEEALVGLVTDGEFSEVPTIAEFELDSLIDSVVASFDIEGEHLQRQSVRSSIVRAFRPGQQVLKPGDKRTAALAALYRDMWERRDFDLRLEVMHQWHRALFAHEESSILGFPTGQFRSTAGPMQVVSNFGNVIHFEAPPSHMINREMNGFLDWLNTDENELELNRWIKVAYAHLWFLTLHPYEDGNGRMARVLSDWLLMRMKSPSRALVSSSMSIAQDKENYYDVLERTQRGNLDISAWCEWFLGRVKHGLTSALRGWTETIERTERASPFWSVHPERSFSREQRKLLERLLRGGENDFPQGISRSQYQSLAGVSASTATRHLHDLVERGIVVAVGQGKATRYRLSE